MLKMAASIALQWSYVEILRTLSLSLSIHALSCLPLHTCLSSSNVCVSVHVLVPLHDQGNNVCVKLKMGQRIVCSVPVLPAAFVLLHLSHSPSIYTITILMKLNMIFLRMQTVALLIILHLIKQVIGLDVALCHCYFVALASPHTQPLPRDSVCETRAHFLFSPPDTF